ncbi:TonB-dependent receptor plug domain-containing protein, partial [bacterium]|nr:TonB-dependent receptor plug domain-containing protein [bacterium]
MRNAMNGCGLLGLALFCSLASVDITAADSEVPIVVTAHRSVTPQSKVGSSFTVITEEQIEQSQRTHVSEILRDVPGIDVVRSGGRGGNTSIFLRGANSEQTLVLLDGIELNNPGNPARAFNFADLTLENVERIEILRGPQSGLYGSDAIGGVINIITKTGEKGTSAEVSSEAGSFDRYVQRARVSHGVQGGNLSLGVTREDEGGISAAEERDGNSEDDGFENTSVTLRAQLQPSETLTIDNTFRYNRSSTDLDNAGGFLGDDPNRELDNEQLFWRTAASARFFDGVWTPTVGVSLSDHEFTDRNDSDPAHVGE